MSLTQLAYIKQFFFFSIDCIRANLEAIQWQQQNWFLHKLKEKIGKIISTNDKGNAVHSYFSAYTEGTWKEGNKGKTQLQEEQYVPFTVETPCHPHAAIFQTQANHRISSEVLPDPIPIPTPGEPLSFAPYLFILLI